MRSVVVAMLLLAGCASSGKAPLIDAGGKGGPICPDHADQCGGQCCGSDCIDTSINFHNCGGCGISCDTGQVCSGGHCGCFPSGATCGMGQSCCPQVGCVSLDTDIKNCGSCGHVCGDGSTCMNGNCVCGSQTCSAGQMCCNGQCATTCGSNNDLAVPPDLSMGGGGLCMCSSHCPISGLCVGPDCCFEDYLIFGTCMPSSTCTQNSNP